ncbi:MAG TPA: proton-conducting transporter membrane subunit [Bacilli bacterium]|nr:proton-conducting transporter membrane subunit [Bacilli bacterium]
MEDVKVTTTPEQKLPFFADILAIQSSRLIIVFIILFGLFVAFRENIFGITDNAYKLGFIYDALVAVTNFKGLPIILVLVPVLGAIIQVFFGQKYGFRRDLVVITMTFITVIIVFLMYPMARNGGITLSLPGLLGLGLSYHIDMLGYTVLFISTIIWFLVMVYAHEYMKREKNSTRFFFFIAFTYSAVLGTIMSGDLLTMFLYFEVMTFTSYMLVIHGQKEESYQAGYNYIIMGLIGGFLILAAMIMLYFHLGDLTFQTAITRLGELGNLRYWIIGLLIMGFGIKAGMAPVHVWLPRAHPVAPTPASALLSGIMIKVGAFGILRVATSFYFPSKDSVTDYLDPIWLTSQNIGAAIIWFGIITMAIGVFLALQQSHMKRMLAYHSVSQMGYIIMGVGIALYLGYRGAMGYSGALYHILNHALFKSLLFMVVGVVYYHTKEYDMYKLGGLWKKLPLTATVCLIACLGISGIPLFNGFISKSILHHGIFEAIEYGHPSFQVAETIFMVVSAGTVCSFIKLFYYTFLKKTENTYPTLRREYSTLDAGMATIALLIVFIGMFPRFLMNHFIIPALGQTTYDPYFINKYIVKLEYFTWSDLSSMAIVLAMGFAIFFLGTKFHWFHLKLPKWLSFEYIFFYPGYVITRNICMLLYGDHCPIDDKEVKQLQLDVGKISFTDRFVLTMNVFNRRYERSIINSDALIYTGFITAILIYMFVIGVI